KNVEKAASHSQAKVILHLNKCSTLAKFAPVTHFKHDPTYPKYLVVFSLRDAFCPIFIPLSSIFRYERRRQSVEDNRGVPRAGRAGHSRRVFCLANRGY